MAVLGSLCKSYLNGAIKSGGIGLLAKSKVSRSYGNLSCPDGSIGKNGDNAGLLVAASALTLSGALCGLGCLSNYYPCAVAVLGSLCKSYLNGAIKSGGIGLLTKSKVSRSYGNLSGPNGCVGENGDYAGLLVAASALALSGALCGLGCLGDNNPCAEAVVSSLCDSDLNAAVKSGGVGLFALLKMSGSLCYLG